MTIAEALDLVAQCRDWIAHEASTNVHGGRLQDFVSALDLLTNSQLGASIIMDALHDHDLDTRLSEVQIKRDDGTAFYLADLLGMTKPSRVPAAQAALNVSEPRVVCVACERMRAVYEAALAWSRTESSDAPTRHETYCALHSAIDLSQEDKANE